jgi:long-subunit acyl-CoA synthetase (AMP-forming)
MAAAGRGFTEESGLTPTQKLKRNVVADDYSEEIAAIYG